MDDESRKAVDSWWQFKFTWTGVFALVAILGIIVAVAIPSYGDYVHRSQASEAVSILGGAKTPLAEYFSEFKRWPKTLGEVSVPTSGKYTLSAAISKGAGGNGELEITATMRTEGVDRRVAGQTVRMVSTDGGNTWACRPGTMPPKNLPGACRD